MMRTCDLCGIGMDLIDMYYVMREDKPICICSECLEKVDKKYAIPVKEISEQLSPNKFGVPYHRYKLTFVDKSQKTIDVGYEEDWGNIQECNPEDCDDWIKSVGYGNDCDGHLKIIEVEDLESDKKWQGNEQILEWANKKVWKYTNNYSN